MDVKRAAKFERLCQRKRFSENELVVDFDDESMDVYFIVAGDVRVLNRTAAGKEIILGDFHAGNFLEKWPLLIPRIGRPMSRR